MTIPARYQEEVFELLADLLSSRSDGVEYDFSFSKLPENREELLLLRDTAIRVHKANTTLIEELESRLVEAALA